MIKKFLQSLGSEQLYEEELKKERSKLELKKEKIRKLYEETKHFISNQFHELQTSFDLSDTLEFLEESFKQAEETSLPSVEDVKVVVRFIATFGECQRLNECLSVMKRVIKDAEVKMSERDRMIDDILDDLEKRMNDTSEVGKEKAMMSDVCKLESVNDINSKCHEIELKRKSLVKYLDEHLFDCKSSIADVRLLGSYLTSSSEKSLIEEGDLLAAGDYLEKEIAELKDRLECIAEANEKKFHFLIRRKSRIQTLFGRVISRKKKTKMNYYDVEFIGTGIGEKKVKGVKFENFLPMSTSIMNFGEEGETECVRHLVTDENLRLLRPDLKTIERDATKRVDHTKNGKEGFKLRSLEYENKKYDILTFTSIGQGKELRMKKWKIELINFYRSNNKISSSGCRPTLIAYTESETELHLIFETFCVTPFYSSNILRDRIGALGWEKLFCCMKGFLELIETLNERGIFLRVLSPRIMFFNHKGDIVIGYAGQSKYLEDMTAFDTTHATNLENNAFSPPELLLQQEEKLDKVDIFSIGCIMKYLIHHHPSNFGKKITDAMNLPMGGRFLRKLIIKCCEEDPEDRISIGELNQLFWDGMVKWSELIEAEERSSRNMKKKGKKKAKK